VRSRRDGRAKRRLPAGLAARLHELSRRERVSLSTTLQTAFHILLSRLSGQDDLQTLGTDLSGDPTFRELLVRVRDSAPRYQDGVRSELDDITLSVDLLAEALCLELSYDAGLFEPGRIEELLRQLEHLLEQAADSPDSRIGALSLVTPASRTVLPDPARPLSGEWMGGGHHALTRHAALQPDRVAVRDARGESSTYAELEGRANRLARFLIDHGVEKGDAVAVWAHRGAPLVQALMGTFKSGAAFLILDPAYPAPRLLDFLRIGRPAAWIGVPGAPPVPSELEAVAGGCRCHIDLRSSELEGFPDTDPAVPVGPDDAACITFTSGSTGVPKAVVGRHGALTHFHPWMGERFGLDGCDRHGMLSALSHDPLQRDVLASIWFGAELVVPDPDAIGTPGYLAGWARRERVTVLNLTPAMLELLLDSAENDLPDLRRVFVVGDQLKRTDVERLYRLAPSAVCVNLYGATETQRALSFFEVPREAGPAKEVLPLGRGFEGCQLLVLNRAGRMAGVGELGEIHIRSRQLARGYLDDDALTAERFRPNPFVSMPEEGDRVYRTGDLGRYLPDGGVELAGRADFQVKLRGFRIELGEVEAFMARFPGVRECVAVIREDEPERKLLVAYLVTPLPVDEADLRAFLSVRLPDFMVPSAFVVLPALPLTHTGKVDRRALPPPGPPVREATAPRNAVEAAVAEAWSGLLGVEEIGAFDDFFALGGRSLMVGRLAALVRESLGVEMPARVVFQEPTVARLAAWIAAERRRVDAARVPVLSPGLAGAASPLSFAQQRLWFLDRLQPGSRAYNMPLDLRLSGPLRPAVLQRSLAEVVRRHAAFRTTFHGASDPVQVVRPAAGWTLPLIDLEALDPGLREAEAARLALAEVRRPFDLGRWPLLRTFLLRLEGDGHRLLGTVHHIVCDGLSMEVLQRELGALYGAFAAGRPSPLAEPPVQYPDFAVWQRSWLSGGELERQLAGWRGRLASPPPPPVLELPADRPRPAIWSQRGAVETASLPASLADRLERLGQSHGATPFMTLLGAFLALLHRYTGQDDLLVGAPVSGRGRPEVAGLIGLFVNMLALRVSLAGDPRVEDLLARVREAALQAYAWQDLPFEALVAELAPGRDLSRNPLVQVVFALHDLPEPVRAGDSLVLAEGEGAHTGTAKFDLALQVGRTGGTMKVRAEYGTDLFDPPTVQRLLGHFRRLLEGLAAGEGGRVSELPLLDAAEREQVLTAWNRTAEEFPQEPVHKLFFRWAEAAPDAVAVSWRSGCLTYGELARRARALAVRLRELGVGPETVVALRLERSAELLTAALAVLEAGGAYLPIDPANPEERQRWILADSEASVVMDPHPRPLSQLQTMASCSAPDSLAYVIYTSGSTGTPKGTELCHRGLSSLIAWHRRAYDLGPGDRTTLLAGPGFDASVWETWAPLTAGASLHIPPPEVVPAPRALLGWMAEAGITVSFLPTPLAEAVLSEPTEGMPEGLRLRALLTGGDRLRRRPAAGLPFEVINHYGPTEGTVVATAGLVTPDGERPPGIGSAIANTRVYLLDRRLQPVPVGVPGELCLAGEGLARGYRRRPGLTAERFVPDPLGDGRRLYRTGDLARRLPSGEIEFLGRFDHQVKIRGVRIETGEVEAALAVLPGVEACVAVARPANPSGEMRLVAYAVPKPGRLLDATVLRRLLEISLPAYMMPSVLVVLPALPLDLNGKVDRRALPEPAASGRAEPASPRTPLEEEVARVWSEVLGVGRVGIEESFWDLGGHSLLATRALARLADTFGVDIPLQALFLAPTLGGFAAVVGDAVLARLSDEEIHSLIEEEDAS
jgi:amino acid adenylation domain-containing protein